MLFCLQWEIGPSRMQQDFPLYRFTDLMLLLKSWNMQSVLTFSTRQAVVPIFWIVSSNSLCNPETFSFSTTTSVMSTWLQIPYWHIICNHTKQWSAWWCTLFVGLVKIWWSLSHVMSLSASLKVANPPNCIKLSKHKQICHNLRLHILKTGGKSKACLHPLQEYFTYLHLLTMTVKSQKESTDSLLI